MSQRVPRSHRSKGRRTGVYNPGDDPGLRTSRQSNGQRVGAAVDNGGGGGFIAGLRSAASTLLNRSRFGERAGLTYGGKRDLYSALGYKPTLDPADYWARYERGDVAERIVEASPRGTWSGGFSLVEDADPDTDTEFESAFLTLLDKYNLESELQKADILAGLGRYSILLLGAPTDTPGSFESELPQLSGPESLLHINAYSEDRATIDEIDNDPASTRFGLPLYYQVRMGTATSTVGGGPSRTSVLTKRVHWSRVIHIAEGTLEDKVYGKPRLRSVWNRLDDLEKLVGGGSEAAWRRMDPGLWVNLDQPPEETDSDEVIVDPVDLDAIQDEVDDYLNNLSRVIRTQGVNITPLSASVANFDSNVRSVLSLVSAATGIPVRILTGSERGELASTQDKGNWAERIFERRREFAVPLVRALVSRLMEYGVLPTVDKYEVVWPEVEELDEKEKAEVVNQFAAANKNQVDATGSILITTDEIRDRILGLAPLEDVVDTGAPAAEQLRAAKLKLQRRATRQRRYRSLAVQGFDNTLDPPEDPEWRAVTRAAQRHRSKVMSVVLASWTAAGVGVNAQQLEDALSAGSVNRAMTAVEVALSRSESDLKGQLSDRLLDTLNDGAESVLRSAKARGSWYVNPPATSPRDEQLRAAQSVFEFDFDDANPRAIRWAQQHSSTLVTNINAETRTALRTMIGEGIADGVPPRRLARSIRQTVGLRPDQLRAVANLETQLRNAKPGTLVTRFPPAPTVRDVPAFRVRIPPGGLTEAQLNSRVSRYREMQHNLRARTIARTETANAANQGQRELWNQAINEGQLPRDQARVWISAGDIRVREAHSSVDGEVVGINESFSIGVEPGEEPNCRCSQGLASPADIATNRIVPSNRTYDAMNGARQEGRKLAPTEIYNTLSPLSQAKVRNYIRRAERNDVQYRALVDDTASQFSYTPGQFTDPQPGTYFYGPLKQDYRIAEKAITDGGGRLETVSDVLRMTYVVNSPDEALALYRNLVSTDAPVNFKNRLIDPSMGGYRDVAFKVTLDDGMLAEVQLNFREILLVKNGRGHEIYEQMRTLKQGTPEFVALQQESERLYGQAWSQICTRFPEFEGCP